MDSSHLTRLIVMAAIIVGLSSVAAAQDYGAKGEPEMLYLSDSDRDNLYLVRGSSGNQSNTLDGVNLNSFDNQSFQACAYYVQLDLRQWDTAGPWDVDCYDRQEFQSLIDQGYFTDLRLQMANRGIN